MTQHTHARPTHRSPVDRLLTRLFRWRSPVARAHRFGHGDTDHGDADATDDVLAQFREQARDLHERVVHDHGVFAVEFLGATGSGKTTLVERLVERAPDEETIGVVVGDVAGDDDARRFREHGVQVANVTTGKECHLDPGLLAEAITSFDLDALDRLYVENVGNMVCPADFPLGAQARVLVVSTTEGDDVVRKHPLLFEACDAAVVNKTDLAAAVGADLDRMAADVGEVAPDMDVFRTNARDDEGVDALASFLADVRADGHGHHDGHAHDHAH
jgi:hydrogenase nickel incorporation protein HypB